MALATNLGFPRIGAHRELKKAVEAYWKGSMSQDEMMQVAKDLRATHWQLQKDASIDVIPSNDFSFYDQVLDTICTLGCVPARYKHAGGNVDIDTYFAMARGRQQDGVDVVAMEMTKWFDTNYHFIVPELDENTEFKLSSTKIVDEYKEAKALGIETRPVILGPVTFLYLSKIRGEVNEGIYKKLHTGLKAVYLQILEQLEQAGCTSVQLDEPALVMDVCEGTKAAFDDAYTSFAEATKMRIAVATYFGDLRDNLQVAAKLPVDELHVDLVRGKAQLAEVLSAWPKEKTLSLGLIDGRNIWKADLAEAKALIEQAAADRGADNIAIAPSCSLLHTPVDLDNEVELDAELKNWLAFAKQKLAEIKALADAANGNPNATFFDANAQAIESRRTSSRIHNDAVKSRLASVDDSWKSRKSAYGERAKVQRPILKLPLLPTTTIGSFPQTTEVRQARAKFKKGELDRAAYDQFLEEETTRCIRKQESLDIDVLVHGEFERNDMVEYFGEKLDGFAFSKLGWVQSYGSRCVKPPIIFGDVSRPEPMTVRWAQYAQSQTERLMKGMLTGPVTILQWSFVRNDQPESDTCAQIALAIRDEVVDLEKGWH